MNYDEIEIGGKVVTVNDTVATVLDKQQGSLIKLCFDVKDGRKVDIDGWWMLDKIKESRPEAFRIKVSGGYLVATKEGDGLYEGVSVCFETEAGDIVDIVLLKSESEDEYAKTDVYLFENIYDEFFTRKYTLDHNEIIKATSGE